MADEAKTPEQIGELTIKVPGPDEPGFLKRSRRALAIQAEIESGDPKAVDALIEFLSDYITKPKAQKEKAALIEDLSQNQISQLIAAISGGGEGNPTASPSES